MEIHVHDISDLKELSRKQQEEMERNQVIYIAVPQEESYTYFLTGSISQCCNCGKTLGGPIKEFEIDDNSFCAECYYRINQSLTAIKETCHGCGKALSSVTYYMNGHPYCVMCLQTYKKWPASPTIDGTGKKPETLEIEVT